MFDLLFRLAQQYHHRHGQAGRAHTKDNGKRHGIFQSQRCVKINLFCPPMFRTLRVHDIHITADGKLILKRRREIPGIPVQTCIEKEKKRTSKQISPLNEAKLNYNNKLENINNEGLKKTLTKLIDAYNAKNN